MRLNYFKRRSERKSKLDDLELEQRKLTVKILKTELEIKNIRKRYYKNFFKKNQVGIA